MTKENVDCETEINECYASVRTLHKPYQFRIVLAT